MKITLVQVFENVWDVVADIGEGSTFRMGKVAKDEFDVWYEMPPANEGGGYSITADDLEQIAKLMKEIKTPVTTTNGSFLAPPINCEECDWFGTNKCNNCPKYERLMMKINPETMMKEALEGKILKGLGFGLDDPTRENAIGKKITKVYFGFNDSREDPGIRLRMEDWCGIDDVFVYDCEEIEVE